LSFVYAMLVKDCTVALIASSLDPYVGFYHQPRFGRPALALDLAEEFRPLIGDSVVLTVVNNGRGRPEGLHPARRRRRPDARGPAVGDCGVRAAHEDGASPSSVRVSRRVPAYA